MRPVRGCETAESPSATPATPTPPLEQDTGLQPEKRHTKLQLGLDHIYRPPTHRILTTRRGTQPHPATYSGYQGTNTTIEGRNRSSYPATHTGGLRQETKPTPHLPTTGSKKHRHEEPPPPQTLSLDLQHPPRIRLVPSLPQAPRPPQWKIPLVSVRRCKSTTHDHGVQRHATPHRSPNERTHIQRAGIRGLEPAQAYRDTHTQQGRTASYHPGGHQVTIGRTSCEYSSCNFLCQRTLR